MESKAEPFSLSLFFSASALLTALWFAGLIYRWHRRNNSSPPLPGPTGLPLVGNLPFLDPELHTYFALLARTYGPIFRLHLGSKLCIVISSPSLARAVLRDHDSTFANRDVPAAVRAISYGGKDILWSPNNPTWRMLRRVTVREMLSPASLDAVYALRRREMRATVAHLRTSAGQPVEVRAQVFLTVLNVITSMLWGGTVEGEQRDKLGEEFRELVEGLTRQLGSPNLSDFFPAIERWDLQGIGKNMAKLSGRFNQIFEGIIQKRREVGERAGKDFLEYMLRMEADGGDPKTPFTMTHVKSLLRNMVIGGTDTTSTTIEWAIAEMLRRPEVLKKVVEELDEVVGAGDIVEESHIAKLHYLPIVIKEVLRLHPTLPLLVPHCPSSTTSIGGYTIPQGSRVFINVWAIQRDPSVWEDEPSEFKPERFLTTPGKWDFSGNDFSYFPFGSGRRICAGIAMAERMVSYSLASLLHSFDWKLPEGEEHDLTEKFGIVLKKARPLVAIPTPRLANPKLYS